MPYFLVKIWNKIKEIFEFLFSHRSWVNVHHRSPSTIHRSSPTVHRSPFTVHRPPFTFTVHRSPSPFTFTVHRSPFFPKKYFFLSFVLGSYSRSYEYVPLPLPSGYRPVTVPLPFWALRYRPLQAVTDRYRILPLLALQALQALPIVL